MNVTAPQNCQTVALRVPPDRSVDAVGAIVEEMSSAKKGRTEASEHREMHLGLEKWLLNSLNSTCFDLFYAFQAASEQVSGILVEDSTGLGWRDSCESAAGARSLMKPEDWACSHPT